MLNTWYTTNFKNTPLIYSYNVQCTDIVAPSQQMQWPNGPIRTINQTTVGVGVGVWDGRPSDICSWMMCRWSFPISAFSSLALCRSSSCARTLSSSLSRDTCCCSSRRACDVAMSAISCRYGYAFRGRLCTQLTRMQVLYVYSICMYTRLYSTSTSMYCTCPVLLTGRPYAP